jgi:hypothetical protein
VQGTEGGHGVGLLPHSTEYGGAGKTGASYGGQPVSFDAA